MQGIYYLLLIYLVFLQEKQIQIKLDGLSV